MIISWTCFYFALWVHFVKGWTEELYGMSAAMYVNATVTRFCESH